MNVRFICGYYSDLAHRSKKRPQAYWDAYFFLWAVKTGLFKRPFSVHFKDGHRERITAKTADRPRRPFGRWLAGESHKLGTDAILVPVPSKDGIIGAANYRTLEMVREALRETPLADAVVDGLRWTERLPKAHEGGRQIILVDDLFSTGGSLLAARDRLNQGAQVLGALTCGRTIYDFDTKPFGSQELELMEELADWQG